MRNVSSTGTALAYLFRDHLGSTQTLVSTSGAAALQLRYGPWGSVRSSSGSATSALQFTGQRRDESLGLLFYQARFYDPAVGRFISADTIVPEPGNPQSLNRYSYVRNAPTRYTDPSGHMLSDGGDQGCGTLACINSPAPPVIVAQAGLPPIPLIPAAPLGGDPTTPIQVGKEWLAGKGPRHHEFRDGDPFTELLQEHEHLDKARMVIAERIRAGNYQSAADLPYDLSGLEGVPKYIRDYSTVATLGQTGNLAVTYLGSYGLEYYIVSLDHDSGTAIVLFHVSNYSTLGSATRPPVIGYTDLWTQNIEPLVTDAMADGPMSTTSQDFWWTETVDFNSAGAP